VGDLEIPMLSPGSIPPRVGCISLSEGNQQGDSGKKRKVVRRGQCLVVRGRRRVACHGPARKKEPARKGKKGQKSRGLQKGKPSSGLLRLPLIFAVTVRPGIELVERRKTTSVL